MRKALACCMRCEVRPDCLRHAIVNYERWGVWGGMRDIERREVIDLTRRHPDLAAHIIDEALASSEAKAREEGLA